MAGSSIGDHASRSVAANEMKVSEEIARCHSKLNDRAQNLKTEDVKNRGREKPVEASLCEA